MSFISFSNFFSKIFRIMSFFKRINWGRLKDLPKDMSSLVKRKLGSPESSKRGRY